MEAFSLEQKILFDYSKYRISMKTSSLNSTELFSEDVLGLDKGIYYEYEYIKNKEIKNNCKLVKKENNNEI